MAENLSDRQAAEAVRTWLDWQYAQAPGICLVSGVWSSWQDA
jgi:hypothetical protein